MTGQPFPFEDFRNAVDQTVQGPGTTDDAARLEEMRVAGYEAGYKSGWDDAVSAAENQASHLRVELAQQISDIQFSYFEAREDVLLQMSHFAEALIDAFFPALLSESSAAALVSELRDMASQTTVGPLALRVSSADEVAVKELIQGAETVDVQILADPALSSGQIRMRGPHSEHLIDVEKLVERLRRSLSAAALNVTNTDEQSDVPTDLRDTVHAS